MLRIFADETSILKSDDVTNCIWFVFSQAQKDLLDAELDVYSASTNGENTLALQRRLNLLKSEVSVAFTIRAPLSTHRLVPCRRRIAAAGVAGEAGAVAGAIFIALSAPEPISIVVRANYESPVFTTTKETK